MSPKGSKIEGSYRRMSVLHGENSAWNAATLFIAAPDNISTNIPTMCQQNDARFAITSTLSSALFYLHYQDEAFRLASKAMSYVCERYIDTLDKIKEDMLTLLPSIDSVTEFPNESRRKNRRRGVL